MRLIKYRKKKRKVIAIKNSPESREINLYGLYWDIICLDQLMTNLIINAIRYGKAESPVTIKVSANDNEALFKVHNEGPAIPDKIKAMITSGTYSKTNGDPTNKDSYGLGL